MKFSTEEYTHPDTGFRRLPPVYDIDANEKVYTLVEMDLAPFWGGLLHRYQIIIVWREDIGKCQYIEDMGVAALWAAGPKSIPSAAFSNDLPKDWCHSVAEVRDMADQLREIDMEKVLGPDHEDLVKGFHDGVDEYWLQRSHVSVSGPLYRIERNGLPLVKVENG